MLDRPGTVRYLPKGAEDNEYTVISKSDVKCIDIYFNTPDTMPMVPAIANIPELENLFTKIYNIWLSKKPNYYIDSMTVLYEIIKTIKNNSKKYISKGQTEKISLAHKYMIEHYKDKNFDYEALCNQTGLSYSYFKELFIAKYKLPPVKYLTALRINYAKNLLITSRYTVSEISEMCGFENVYYFSTVFKKHTGVSPTTYIKNPDNI